MAFPVDITFRDMPSSPSIEASVRRWAERLSREHQRIQHCHVVIQRPHQHRRRGHVFEVHLEVTVPGRVIAVSHTPGQPEEHDNLYVAIADAFRAARRQLHDYAAVRRDGSQAQA